MFRESHIFKAKKHSTHALPGLAEEKLEHSTGSFVDDHPSSTHTDLDYRRKSQKLDRVRTLEGLMQNRQRCIVS